VSTQPLQPAIDIGKLNRRVQILARTAARDTAGGQSDIWAPVAERWASIDIQYSALTYETTEFMSKATYRIVLRYDKALALSVANRIQNIDPGTNTTHVYEIESIVNPGQRNEQLLLLCYTLDDNQ
jgi:SPP1 family predicted phage head-tail adaptor